MKTNDIAIPAGARNGANSCRTDPPRGHRPRLLIECTHTYLHGGNAGIQRVVRNIVNNCRRVGATTGVECVPVICFSGQFAEIDRLGIMPSQGPAALQWLKQTAWPRFQTSLHEFHRGVLRLLPGRLMGRTGLFRTTIPIARRLFRSGGRILLQLAAVSSGRIVRPRRGDVLVLLDAPWRLPVKAISRRLHARGVSLALVVYDLIPLLHPEVCSPPHVANFGRWFAAAAPCADLFVGISRSAADEARRYLWRHPALGASRKPVGHFQLGQGLDTAVADGPIRPALRELFEVPGHAPYITVSTLEPRKNHAFLLDAMEQVWEGGVAARLCIIGREGWEVDELLARIRHHERLGRELWWFDDLTDAELAYAYARARATVLPSMAEGFGLPVVEALSRGSEVLASDIPPHREVGGEHAVFFELGDPASLAELIVRHETTGLLPPHRPPREYRWKDWPQSCRELIDAVIALSHPAAPRQTPNGGSGPIAAEPPQVDCRDVCAACRTSPGTHTT